MTLCYALPFKLQENDVSKCNQKMCIHEVCEKATHFVCMTLRSGSGSGSMSTAGAHGRYDYSQREQWECERCNKGYVGTRAQVLYSNRSLAMSSLSSVRSHTLSMTMILQQRKIHPNNGEGSLSLLLFDVYSIHFSNWITQVFPFTKVSNFSALAFLWFNSDFPLLYCVCSVHSLSICLWLTFILPLFQTVQRRS